MDAFLFREKAEGGAPGSLSFAYNFEYNSKSRKPLERLAVCGVNQVESVGFPNGRPK